MRLHFSIGCYDCRKTTRFRQGLHFWRIQVLFAAHMHSRAGVNNKCSFLRIKIWCRQAPIVRRWESCCFVFLIKFQNTFGQLPRCFAGRSLLPLCLLLSPILQVSPFYNDWLTSTDRTTGLLLQSDRLIFGTHQGASDRWWRHRSRSHQGTAARSKTPGCIRHEPLWWRGPWAHNLWEAPRRPGCQGPQRKYAGYLSTTSWKLKVSGSKNSRVIREMIRKKMKWMEKSKRSEATLTERMNHEDDHGMNRESNLSQTVCVYLNKENNQGTMTLTTRRRNYRKELSCGSIHSVHESLDVLVSFFMLQFIAHVVVLVALLLLMHQIYSLSDLYGNSL